MWRGICQILSVSRCRLCVVESSFGEAEMDIVADAFVLLCKKRGMFLFTAKKCVYARIICSSSFHFARLSLRRPLVFCIPCLIRLPLISFLSGSSCFISDIKDYVLADNDQPQSKQPLHLAGGNPKLVNLQPGLQQTLHLSV